MKYVLIVLVFTIQSYAAQPVYQLYKNSPLTHIRTVTTADTAIDLTANGGDFASKPTAAINLGTADDGTAHTTQAEFSACMTDADGTAGCTITYWGWRVGINATCGGPAVKLFSITTAAIGTMDVVKFPDGSTATAGFWVHQGTVTGYALNVTNSVYNSGNNNVLLVRVDLMGYAWIYPEITDITGTPTAVKTYIAGL